MRVPAARMQTDRQEARQQLGVLRNDAQVSREREVEPGADRATADRRDRRGLERPDAREGSVDRADRPVDRRVRAVVARGGQAADAAAGAGTAGGPGPPPLAAVQGAASALIALIVSSMYSPALLIGRQQPRESQQQPAQHQRNDRHHRWATWTGRPLAAIAENL